MLENDGTKYGKYFLELKNPTNMPFLMGPVLTRMDNSMVKGSNFYFMHWVTPHEEPRMKIGHPPHIHKEAELLFHVGADPDNPSDLGAEVELYMGPELERHVITKSTVVFIPPNCLHAPWNPLRTWRSWIFIEVNQGIRHTEKFYPQLLTPEQRASEDQSRWVGDNMEDWIAGLAEEA